MQNLLTDYIDMFFRLFYSEAVERDGSALYFLYNRL